MIGVGVQSQEPFLRVLEFSVGEGAIVIVVEGEIDLATVDHLERALAGICERADAVTVDLRRVGFLDCPGLRLLLDLSAEGAAHDCRVAFIQGPAAVARVFELTGMGRHLAFVDAVLQPTAALSTA
jgi:anti-anti-sigma factor